MLIILPVETIPSGTRSILWAVGITTKPLQRQLENGLAVQLPDKTRFPETKSGLDEPSWAIADWVVEMNPCQTTKQAGFVSADLVIHIQRLIRENRIRPVSMLCDPAYGDSCHYCR